MRGLCPSRVSCLATPLWHTICCWWPLNLFRPRVRYCRRLHSVLHHNSDHKYTSKRKACCSHLCFPNHKLINESIPISRQLGQACYNNNVMNVQSVVSKMNETISIFSCHNHTQHWLSLSFVRWNIWFKRQAYLIITLWAICKTQAITTWFDWQRCHGRSIKLAISAFSLPLTQHRCIQTERESIVSINGLHVGLHFQVNHKAFRWKNHLWQTTPCLYCLSD